MTALCDYQKRRILRKNMGMQATPTRTPWLWTWVAGVAMAHAMMIYIGWALGDGSLFLGFSGAISVPIITAGFTLAVYLRWGDAACFTSGADFFNFAGVALGCALGTLFVLIGYAVLIMSLVLSNA
jgi:hypothetical protein